MTTRARGNGGADAPCARRAPCSPYSRCPWDSSPLARSRSTAPRPPSETGTGRTAGTEWTSTTRTWPYHRTPCTTGTSARSTWSSSPHTFCTACLRRRSTWPWLPYAFPSAVSWTLSAAPSDRWATPSLRQPPIGFGQGLLAPTDLNEKRVSYNN